MHYINYSIVSVISAARFENTIPAPSPQAIVHWEKFWPWFAANFKNGMETGRNILIGLVDNIILSLLCSASENKVQSLLHYKIPHVNVA